jgi:hypothetical protein
VTRWTLAAGPGVHVGRGWRGGGYGAEFLTFILFRRYDVPVDDYRV